MTRRIVFLVFLASVLFLTTSCLKGGEEPKQTDTSTAPLFVLESIGGKKVSLADYRGKVVVLEFFATWCEPCRISAPELQSIYSRYKERGVAVIAIAADEGPNAIKRVKAFVKEYRLSYDAVIDSGQVMKQYGAFTLPTTVIIDREGKIRGKHLGISGDYAKRLTSEIGPLLKQQEK
jgi:peroxiredoxin